MMPTPMGVHALKTLYEILKRGDIHPPPDEFDVLVELLQNQLKNAFQEIIRDSHFFIVQAAESAIHGSAGLFKNYEPIRPIADLIEVADPSMVVPLHDEPCVCKRGWLTCFSFGVIRRYESKLKKLNDILTSATIPPPSQDLINLLEDDLRKLFPEVKIDPLDLIISATEDAIKRYQEDCCKYSPLHLFELAVARFPGCDQRCLPKGRKVDGWMACNTFRYAKVHQEAAKHGEKMRKRFADRFKRRERQNYLAIRNIEKEEERIQKGLLQALKKAGLYNCGDNFEAWIKRMGSNLEIDENRKSHKTPLTTPKPDPTVTEKPKPGHKPSTSPRGGLIYDPDFDWDEIIANVDIDGDILFDQTALGILPKEETWKRAAASSLRARGIASRSESVLAEQIKLVKKTYIPFAKKRMKKKGIVLAIPDDPDPDVPLAKYKLKIALAIHQEFQKEFLPDDPVSPVLSQVEIGFQALIKALDDTANAHPLEKMPVEVLARIQTDAWTLVHQYKDNRTVADVAANLKWFSWEFHAAATLAACVRHLERMGDPTSLAVASRLRNATCVKNLTEPSRTIVIEVNPSTPPRDFDGDPDGPSDHLVRAAFCSLLKVPDSKTAKKLANELPEADWELWHFRQRKPNHVGPEQGLELTRRLAKTAGLLAN